MNESGQRPRGAVARRSHVTLSVSRVVSGLLSPAARRRGFAEASILNDWPSIVGKAFASRCQPISIDFRRGTKRQGVLTLRAAGGAALELQHQARQIIERVNDYLGFDAVRHLRIQQGSLPARHADETDEARCDLTAEEEEGLEQRLRDIDQRELSDALRELGRTITAGSRR
ncbi:MAG: DciA family protein [Geminicoccaceae bacterium]